MFSAACTDAAPIDPGGLAISFQHAEHCGTGHSIRPRHAIRAKVVAEIVDWVRVENSYNAPSLDSTAAQRCQPIRTRAAVLVFCDSPRSS
jgi:hypothetical protein